MTVRLATPDDLPLLAEYWYDQVALRSQKHISVRLLPDAEARWQQYAHTLLQADHAQFLIAELEGDVLACAIGHIEPNEIGLYPPMIGRIDNIILDLHSPHKRKNAVTELLDALKQYYRQSDIQHIIVTVPTYSPVEQGFWRGLGLHHIKDTFWMDLK